MLSAVMSAARPLPEEQEEDERDEGHADEEVLEHRVRRDVHERAAVVVGHDVHPRREEVVLPDVVDPLVDPLERRRRLAAVAHEDDALHDVGLVVVPDDAEARRVPEVHVGDVADADGDALLLGDDDVLDVVHVMDEADPADVVRLLADGEPLAADVLVGVLMAAVTCWSVTPWPRRR